MPPLGHGDGVDPKPKLLGLSEDLSRFCQIIILLLLLAHSCWCVTHAIHKNGNYLQICISLILFNLYEELWFCSTQSYISAFSFLSFGSWIQIYQNFNNSQLTIFNSLWSWMLLLLPPRWSLRISLRWSSCSELPWSSSH